MNHTDSHVQENETFQSVILNDRPPVLANYPHAKIVGNMVYFSAFSSRQADNSRVGVTFFPDGSFTTDIVLQTRAVIENLKGAMESLGSTLENLVDITVYLTDLTTISLFNKTYNEYFSKEKGPTRSVIKVAALPHPSILVEMRAIGYLP